jgi:shikimate dehydrogenase
MLTHLNGATRIFPVIGDPIAQVKSPLGVSQEMQARGENAICVPLHITGHEFEAFFKVARNIHNMDGFIITIPHKFSASRVCDDLSARARFLGSVNTIRKDKMGRLIGDMFDGLAFVESCKQKGAVFQGKLALLAGAGGAGSAIAHAICEAGVSELHLIETDDNRANALIKNLRHAGFNISRAHENAAHYDIVCNATPLGMRLEDPLPFAMLFPHQFVGDVVTMPAIPALIEKARALECKTSTGSEMFLCVRDLMINFLLEKNP